MSRIHRLGRSVAVAGVALLLVVGATFARGVVFQPSSTSTTIAPAVGPDDEGADVEEQIEIEDQVGDTDGQQADVEDEADDIDDGQQGDVEDQQGDDEDEDEAEVEDDGEDGADIEDDGEDEADDQDDDEDEADDQEDGEQDD